VIVVDASVLAPALADDGPDGDRARTELAAAGPLVAPEIVDLEVVSVLRKAALAGRLDDRRARHALDDLAALPMRRVPHGPLVGRIWELRQTLTPYDAAYVAIAELLGAPLLTADRRLAGAPGVACEIIALR
jgi:predicted nucleic acid-binding protein